MAKCNEFMIDYRLALGRNQREAFLIRLSEVKQRPTVGLIFCTFQELQIKLAVTGPSNTRSLK
jgi:hypothetical protein